MFDYQKNGEIDADKIRTILNTLGNPYDEAELERLIRQEDKDGECHRRGRRRRRSKRRWTKKRWKLCNFSPGELFQLSFLQLQLIPSGCQETSVFWGNTTDLGVAEQLSGMR